MDAEEAVHADRQTFHTLAEFAEYLLMLRKETSEQLERIAKDIIIGKKALRPSFESWLIILGKNAELVEWKEGEVIDL